MDSHRWIDQRGQPTRLGLMTEQDALMTIQRSPSFIVTTNSLSVPPLPSMASSHLYITMHYQDDIDLSYQQIEIQSITRSSDDQRTEKARLGARKILSHPCHQFQGIIQNILDNDTRPYPIHPQLHKKRQHPTITLGKRKRREQASVVAKCVYQSYKSLPNSSNIHSM